MTLYRKYKFLQLVTLINVAVSLFLIFAILGTLTTLYLNLPIDSPIREKLKIGKLISLFEFEGLFYNYRNLGLPIYELDISGKNLQKIYDNLPPADSIMTDKYKTYVPATFRFEGKEYEVNVRIRGMTSNHWREKKKSWRIKFKNKNLFKGMKNIDLIIPQDRAYISEHLSNYIAKKMGLLAPDSGFAFLAINGRFQGIYFETEHPGSAKFLERHHRTANANFYSDDNWNWYQFGFPALFEHIGHWEKDSSEKLSIIDNYADLNHLLELLNNASDEQFHSAIPNILNIEKFLRWQSHSVLMGSHHQGTFNMNLYFDAVSGKFEPVPWDVHIWALGHALEDISFDKPYNPLVTRILRIPEFRHRRNLILWNYVNNPANLKDNLDFYDKAYEMVEKAFFVDRNKGFSNFRFKREAKRHRDIIINNHKTIKKNLSSIKLLVTTQLESNPATLGDNGNILAILDIAHFGLSAAMLKTISFKLSHEDKNAGQLYLFFDKDNSGILDKDNVRISTFKYSVDDKCFISEEIEKLLYSQRDKQLQPQTKNYRFFIANGTSLSDTELSEINVIAYNAVTQEIIEPKYRYIDNRTFGRLAEVNQSPDEFAKLYNFFARSDASPNKFIIESGEHIIDKTVIVPKGLQILIQPGAILKFAPDISLISYSQIEGLGNNDYPIIFTALEDGERWGVFAVVGTGKARNIFKNVIIEYGGEAFINGIYFTGALAIHAADTEVENCIFRYNKGNDAINIKQGDAIIKNCFFNNNSSDAVDHDFASGLIENNLFVENGGDGIDLCNSHITLVSNHIKQSGDKGVSVGEESNPLIINNLIHSCAIGIAIKDNSNPHIINNTIVNNEFGIKSYMKKPVFGGAKGVMKNAIIWGNKTNIQLDDPSSLEVSSSLVQGGWKGNGVLDAEPLFNEVGEEDYTLRRSSENQLFKGTRDNHIEELFPEFKDKFIPMGILFLPNE